MASTFSTNEEKAIAVLTQIKDAIMQLQEWNAGKKDAPSVPAFVADRSSTMSAGHHNY